MILRGCRWTGDLLAIFFSTFGGLLVRVQLYWEFMGLGFPRYNVGEIYLPSLVAGYDRHVYLRKVWHMFSSVSYYPCIPPFKKSYVVCGSLWHCGFKFRVFSSIDIFL